jgi:hypothetical protein
MAYQYQKDQDTLGKEGCDEDPMSILLHQLMGIGSKKPRKLAGFNIFSKECYDKDIRPKLNAWLKLNPTAQKDVPKVRSKLTRDVFNSLDAEVRKGYEERAKTLHGEAMQRWKERIDSPPSQNPQDQQK